MSRPRTETEWLVLCRSLQEPRRQTLQLVRVRDQRLSDWLLLVLVFGPGMFGVFLFLLSLLGWLGWR